MAAVLPAPPAALRNGAITRMTPLSWWRPVRSRDRAPGSGPPPASPGGEEERGTVTAMRIPGAWTCVRAGACAMALAAGLAACAEVDLDNLVGSTPTPTPTAVVIPTGMVMPTPVPTEQSTAASSVTVAFPEIADYTVEATPSPTATESEPDVTTQSQSYSSRTTMCTVAITTTASSQLVVTGGDDRLLSESWADEMGSGYQSYRETSRLELTGVNGSTFYAGVATAFSAKVSGSDVTGKAFVRAWSADGVVLSATQVCQKGAFDDDAWDAVIQGVTISGLSGSSRWPGGEPTSRPTDTAPPATPAETPEETQAAAPAPESPATAQPTR